MQIESTLSWEAAHEKYGIKPVEGEILYRFFHITDAHNSPLGRIPSSRTENYFKDTEREYQNLHIASVELKAQAVASSGDWFHLKSQALYHPESMSYTADKMEQFDIPFIHIPGNHDLPNSSYEEIKKSAYFSVMRMTSNAIDLSTSTSEDGNSIQLTPRSWTPPDSQTSFPITFWGLPYFKKERLLAEMDALNERMTESGINVVLLHGDFFPDGYPNPFVEPIFYSELCRRIGKANIFCLGHIHESYSVHTQASEQNGRPQFISKPWSWGRVVRDYHQSTEVLENRHKPSFACVTAFISETGAVAVDIQYGVIPHRPFEEVFLRESVVEEIKTSVTTSEYIQKLREGLAESEISDPQSFLDGRLETQPQRVREIINDHLQRAG